MPRYVILLHDCPADFVRPSHWDVMFERDGVLQTWAVHEPPDGAGPIAAELLPDHRLAYLDYEGPLSQDRGSVVRWDRGTYQARQQDELRWELMLAGEQLAGQVTLERQADVGGAGEAQRWTFFFSRLPSATPGPESD